jgi:hypothetical protein
MLSIVVLEDYAVCVGMWLKMMLNLVVVEDDAVNGCG